MNEIIIGIDLGTTNSVGLYKSRILFFQSAL